MVEQDGWDHFQMSETEMIENNRQNEEWFAEQVRSLALENDAIADMIAEAGEEEGYEGDPVELW